LNKKDKIKDEIKFNKLLENLFEPEEFDMLKKVVQIKGGELISDDI
jgi:hypothetical protein